jgi:hypothetical protein
MNLWRDSAILVIGKGQWPAPHEPKPTPYSADPPQSPLTAGPQAHDLSSSPRRHIDRYVGPESSVALSASPQPMEHDLYGFNYKHLPATEPAVFALGMTQ